MNNLMDESDKLYVLFLLHAQGKRIVPHSCPNCGDMPHLKQIQAGRSIYTCLECDCVSSSIDPTTKDQI